MLKYFEICFLLFLLSCSQQKVKPAETPLDAAREYKTACLNGEFDKANFYLTNNSKQSFYFQKLQDDYNKLLSNQKKEIRESSLIIYSVKEKFNNTTQIILADSYTKIKDTIDVVKQNKMWLIQLK